MEQSLSAISSTSASLTPVGAHIAIALHAVFDTGVIIDTFTLTPDQYATYSANTYAVLAKAMPEVEWKQEQAILQDNFDSLPESYPVLNLSFLMARSATLFPAQKISFQAQDASERVLSLSEPTIYFHAFKGGILSLVATPEHGESWTMADWQTAESRLMNSLDEVLGTQLRRVVAAFTSAVRQTRVPLYATPFLDAGKQRTRLLDWSHRIFLARVDDSAALAETASALAGLMRPINQKGVENMSLTAGRFVYLGSGRSMICYTSAADWRDANRNNEGNVRSYVRMVEVRNYVWRTLYDLDRSLRNAIARSRSTADPRAARSLVTQLHELDFRVTGVLEELDPYKLTFDNESVYLMQQLDLNWLTADLVASLKMRLASLSNAYSYHEETVNRDREARLRAVLNLIGFVATAGSVAQIIGFFDPLNNQLPADQRALLLVGSIAVIILVYLILLSLNLRARR